MKNLTDEQLITRLREGETEPLDELYSRYAKKLYLFFAYSMQVKNAEDLIHDVFLKVIKAANKFDPKKAAFRTWLFSIARNHCLDFLRHEKKIRFVSLEDNKEENEANSHKNLSESLSDQKVEVEPAFIRMSIHEAVNSCIHALTNEEERQVIVLYYSAGKVYREIGDILGYSISSVKKWLSRALEKVRICLEQKGIDSIN